MFFAKFKKFGLRRILNFTCGSIQLQFEVFLAVRRNLAVYFIELQFFVCLKTPHVCVFSFILSQI